MMNCPRLYLDGKGSFTIDDAIAFYHYSMYEREKAFRFGYDIKFRPIEDFFTEAQITEAYRIIKETRVNEIKSKIKELQHELRNLEQWKK